MRFAENIIPSHTEVSSRPLYAELVDNWWVKDDSCNLPWPSVMYCSFTENSTKPFWIHQMLILTFQHCLQMVILWFEKVFLCKSLFYSQGTLIGQGWHMASQYFYRLSQERFLLKLFLAVFEKSNCQTKICHLNYWSLTTNWQICVSQKIGNIPNYCPAQWSNLAKHIFDGRIVQTDKVLLSK